MSKTSWDGSGRERRSDPVIYNEGSFFQTKDGILHMMLRTEVNWLAVSESSDDGEFGYMIYSAEKEDIGAGRFRIDDLR